MSNVIDRTRVAEADRIRAEQDARRKANTRRRHGHKGSRQWGWNWHADALRDGPKGSDDRYR